MPFSKRYMIYCACISISPTQLPFRFVLERLTPSICRKGGIRDKDRPPALVPVAGAGGAETHEDLDTLIAPLNQYRRQFNDSIHLIAAFVICTSSNLTDDGKLSNGPPVHTVYRLFKPGVYNDGTLNVKIKKLAERMRSEGVNLNSINLSDFWDTKISEVVPLWKLARLGARNEAMVAED